MPLYNPTAKPVPDFWRAFGHSWLQNATGPSGDQTGRTDSLFRAALDIEYNNWQNHGMNGARICGSNISSPLRHAGGWVKVAQACGITGRAAPYAPDGGATLFVYGINDLGTYGGQTTAVRTTMVDTHRACISRARASVVYPVTDSHWAFTNWTLQATGLEQSSSGSTRSIAVTTTNNATLTLPSDYAGETIAIAWLLRPGATAATVTYSGTAGVTGTFYSGGGGQSAGEHAFTVSRIYAAGTNNAGAKLTSANAGQTIIMTCTSLDASGIAFVDSAWLESKTPGPVIVCNVAKSATGSGYGYYNAFYNTWSATSTRSESAMDADVDSYNSALATMVGEFDGMVQIADMDAALNPGGVKGVTTNTNDGIHPNEIGAGPIVDAMVRARNRLTPPAGAFGETLSFNTPSARASNVRRARFPGYYQRPELYSPAYTTYTPVALEMYAFPFVITEGRDQYARMGLVCTTVGTVAPTLRWGVYDNIQQETNYPRNLMAGLDPNFSSAYSSATTPAATSVRDSPTFTGGFNWLSDPGLYWLVIKIETAGTGQVWQAMTGQSPYLPWTNSTGTTTTLFNCWKLTSQATGVMPNTFPTGAVLTGGAAPLLQLFKNK